MLDLGTSFLASVARDPDALAIVDRELRLTYGAWYGKISALVAGFDDLGLRPGDHLVTLLQNRWEAATIHWACQFAGIIITPLNWRSTAEELDYVLVNAEAKELVDRPRGRRVGRSGRTGEVIGDGSGLSSWNHRGLLRFHFPSREAKGICRPGAPRPQAS